EGNEREIPRVQASTQGGEPYHLRHVCGGQPQDAMCRFLHRPSQRFGNEPGDCGLRQLGTKPDVLVVEPLRVDMAEPAVVIGHGWALAASCINGRTWRRAGAVRTHLDHASPVYLRDGAAARSDLDDVDHGTEDRISTDIATIDETVSVEFSAEAGFAVDHN